MTFNLHAGQIAGCRLKLLPQSLEVLKIGICTNTPHSRAPSVHTRQLDQDVCTENPVTPAKGTASLWQNASAVKSNQSQGIEAACETRQTLTDPEGYQSINLEELNTQYADINISESNNPGKPVRFRTNPSSSLAQRLRDMTIADSNLKGSAKKCSLGQTPCLESVRNMKPLDGISCPSNRALGQIAVSKKPLLPCRKKAITSAVPREAKKPATEAIGLQKAKDVSDMPCNLKLQQVQGRKNTPQFARKKVMGQTCKENTAPVKPKPKPRPKPRKALASAETQVDDLKAQNVQKEATHQEQKAKSTDTAAIGTHACQTGKDAAATCISDTKNSRPEANTCAHIPAAIKRPAQEGDYFFLHQMDDYNDAVSKSYKNKTSGVTYGNWFTLNCVTNNWHVSSASCTCKQFAVYLSILHPAEVLIIVIILIKRNTFCFLQQRGTQQYFE